ncbi:2-amino-4-hydroxy-6-hydroxymethyldihydropteridine diphosphokinase [Aestuariibacter halophilus]|uniref:2-amino-4-hydroxy-6-hydroxymethyldihydropteridine diphosphokinase n=1 Tax=Fluctibacter halophilus TaxID=226011 RepID=A0ABS8G7C4_9ALTE|nr:2-amino-4-hydroxy-6-hydroxymethyldihydropteridine diphosphokinase [Aestuariibacter halophilus]MCC2616423.1 2-amino-4-hydroxy-6-hydroxymethyldihydropteridine diphosphokinase [Aestuariibacter halophilus]
MARIYISLGTNIDRARNTRSGLDALHDHFGALTCSRLYESEAVGFQGNPFYNMVIAADTEQSIAQVVQCLKRIEQDNGRVRGEKKFAPRTLDLDLLLYDDIVCQEPVVLPREEICFNAFVLLPLAEIAPERVHPVNQTSYADLWSAYTTPQRLWPIDFTWRGSEHDPV